MKHKANNKNIEFRKNKYAKQKTKLKYLLVILISIILSIIGLMLFYKLYIAAPKDDEVLARINSQALTVEEFRLVMYKNRANTYSYFNKKYNTNANKNFWNTAYDGEKPIDKIRKDSLEQCIEAKIKQLVAVEKGVLADASYSAFLKNFSAQNLQRKENLKNGKILYGPEQYDLQAYYDVMLNKIITDTKNMIKSETNYSDQESFEYYDRNKEVKFKKTDSSVINVVAINPNENKDKSRVELQQIMLDIKARLNNGEDFEKIEELFSKGEAVKINFRQQLMDDNSVKEDMLEYPVIREKALELSLGQISDIFESEGVLYIVSLISRSSGGYKDFESQKEYIKVALAAEEYGRNIEDLIKNAKVEIIENVYERVEME